MSSYRYGSPKISLELREQGIMASNPRVNRLMLMVHLKSITFKKYRVQTTDSKHQYAIPAIHLDRNISAKKLTEACRMPAWGSEKN